VRSALVGRNFNRGIAQRTTTLRVRRQHRPGKRARACPSIDHNERVGFAHLAPPGVKRTSDDGTKEWSDLW
jgi:hypothetical protein